VKLADKYVAEINSRNKTAILVGGTGLYLKAFRFGLTEQIEKDQLIRDRLDQEVKELGLDNLYERLKQIDPASLDNIKSNDKIRITRALEIYEITKKKPSELRQNFENTEQNIRVKADWHLIMPEREVLLKRLELRAELMFEQGLVEEAVYLKEYLGADHPLCKTMGYEEAIKLASGELTEQEALEKVIIRQRQYAKRQKTWFQKEDWWEHAV